MKTKKLSPKLQAEEEFKEAWAKLMHVYGIEPVTRKSKLFRDRMELLILQIRVADPDLEKPTRGVKHA